MSQKCPEVPRSPKTRQLPFRSVDWQDHTLWEEEEGEGEGEGGEGEGV